MPDRFTIGGDLATTVLLARAFDDVRAAAVLSQTLRLAPLPPRTREGLATSWLAHNLRRPARRRGRDPIAWKLLYGRDDDR